MIIVSTVNEYKGKKFVGFHPQITLNYEKWQHEQKYQLEDSAYEHAAKAAAEAIAAYRAVLASHGFYIAHP